MRKLKWPKQLVDHGKSQGDDCQINLKETVQTWMGIFLIAQIINRLTPMCICTSILLSTLEQNTRVEEMFVLLLLQEQRLPFLFLLILPFHRDIQ